MGVENEKIEYMKKNSGKMMSKHQQLLISVPYMVKNMNNSKRTNSIVFRTLGILFFSAVPMVGTAATSIEVQENIDTLVRTNTCAECNLSGAELNRLDLSGADLRGADLSNATFFLTDLSGADLRGAVMRGTQLGGADLAGADLRQADLRGVRIAGAYLVGARIDGTFSEVSVTDDEGFQDVVEKTYIPDDTVPKKVPENQNVTIGERRDFTPVPPQIDQAEMTVSDEQEGGPVRQDAPPIKEVSPVNDVVVKYEPVEQAGELADTDKKLPVDSVQKSAEQMAENPPPAAIVENTLKDNNTAAAPVSLQEEKTDISTPTEQLEPLTTTPSPVNSAAEADDARLEKTAEKIDTTEQLPDSPDSEEPAAQALPGHLALVKQVSKSKKCYGCNLAGSDFSGKNLDGADLEGSDFSGANLENTDFEDANLKGVSFRNARLIKAKFNGADLYRADFSGADLTGATFKKALIDEANFQDAVGYGELMLAPPQ